MAAGLVVYFIESIRQASGVRTYARGDLALACKITSLPAAAFPARTKAAPLHSALHEHDLTCLSK